MSRVLWTLVIANMLLLAGCSEDPPPADMDTEPPQVRVLYPPDVVDDQWVVSDTVSVYVGAADNTAVSSVDVFFSAPTDPNPQPVGTTTQPISLAEVPDSVAQLIQLPETWSLYTVGWGTKFIVNGSRPRLFARASDPAGNEGVSEIVTVLVLNTGQNVGPPDPEFSITPPEGTYEVEFVFDPRETIDAIDADDRIAVRWDFEGDETWEIDWDAGATAVEIQRWKYDEPKVYEPAMEARNTYVSNSSRKDRTVDVSDIGGEPNPPEPANYVEVPPGTYSVGAPSNAVGDYDEFPLHPVTLRQAFMIEKTEVINRLYLNYVRAAMATNDERKQVIFQNNNIVRKDLAPPQDSAIVYLRLPDSRIFYDVDIDGFRIQAGFDEHPVTGVSWHGARAYALFYGLRLPYEAEWEIAVKGDSAAWNFPYGRDLRDGDPTGRLRINYVGSGDPFSDEGTTPRGYYNGETHDGFQTIDTPSYFGLYDVAGNVAEWASDWHALYPPEAQTDPQGPLRGELKVVRGGSFQHSSKGIRATGRDAELPDGTYPSIGFRTAYTSFGVGP